MQTGNKDGFLSTGLGLMVYNEMDEKERFTDYREYLYAKERVETGKGASIDVEILAEVRGENY